MVYSQIVTTIRLVKIEFDIVKNDWNVQQQSLWFECVADFELSTAIVPQDVRKTYSEMRFVAVEFLNARFYALCFTPVDGGIRVISFRKTKLRKIKVYEKTRPAH